MVPVGREEEGVARMELDLNLVHVLRKGMALEVRVGDVKEGEVVELAARDDLGSIEGQPPPVSCNTGSTHAAGVLSRRRGACRLDAGARMVEGVALTLSKTPGATRFSCAKYATQG